MKQSQPLILMMRRELVKYSLFSREKTSEALMNRFIVTERRDGDVEKLDDFLNIVLIILFKENFIIKQKIKNN